MNTADLEARLRDLPPELSQPHDRLEQIEGRVRRNRTRRRIVTVASVSAALCIAIPTALLASRDASVDARQDVATTPPSPTNSLAMGDLMPGADRVVTLSEPRMARGRGTTTIDLGKRPAGATGVSTNLNCLSPGTVRWPDGASLVCDAADVARMKQPTSQGYVIDLAPDQTRLVITSDAGMSWRISTTYVKVEPTEWAVNANGETYGAPKDTAEPDLIGIWSPSGVVEWGRSEDLNAGAADLEEALASTENGNPYLVPTYDIGGTTIVGTFEQGTPDPQAIEVVVGSAPAGAVAGEATGQLTVTADGCLYLDTAVGKRWLILPWGYQLTGTTDEGALETVTGDRIASLNGDATFSGEALAKQQVEGLCATGLPPFYVTAR